MSALIEAARDALEAWDSLPRKTYSLSTSVSEWLEYRMAPAIARLRTALAAAEQPAEPVALTPAAMKRGGFYNWKNQPDRLIYLRRFDGWHQFKKIGDPREVWCEVLDDDLHMLEETAASPAAPAQAPTEPAGVPIRAPFDHCRPSGIAYDLPGLVFTASQLREALAFFGGEEGDEDDPVTVTIALRDAGKDIDGEPRPRGLYVWMTEYPEEGSIVLDGIGSKA